MSECNCPNCRDPHCLDPSPSEKIRDLERELEASRVRETHLQGVKEAARALLADIEKGEDGAWLAAARLRLGTMIHLSDLDEGE